MDSKLDQITDFYFIFEFIGIRLDTILDFLAVKKLKW
jgi:hypothetical protein